MKLLRLTSLAAAIAAMIIPFTIVQQTDARPYNNNGNPTYFTNGNGNGNRFRDANRYRNGNRRHQRNWMNRRQFGFNNNGNGNRTWR
jgi:hypothetical protein